MDHDIPEIEAEEQDERDEETGPFNRGDSEPDFVAEFEVRYLLFCRTLELVSY